MNKNTLKKARKASICIHAGGQPDKETGAVMPPIYQTSTYAQTSPGVHQGYEYTRSHNPTRTRLEESLAALEDAKYSLVTSSGVSVEVLIMHSLAPGSTILCGDDVYGGTYRLFTTVFNTIHNFIFIDTTNEEIVKQAIAEHRPALVWIETPTNPMLKLIDIKAAAKIAQSNKLMTVVDNTFMSPYFQRPIELGADIVVHSTTKFINGHSDVVGGAVVAKTEEHAEELAWWANCTGVTGAPFDSFQTLRGLRTLFTRMDAQERNAKDIVAVLRAHDCVAEVYYPDDDLAARQQSGPGAMLSFALASESHKAVSAFLSDTGIFQFSESLGGTESLICHPATMTHRSMTPEAQTDAGIGQNLIRVSVGLEHVDDQIAALMRMFENFTTAISN